VAAIAAMLIVFGFTQLRKMPVDALPEFSRPYVEIQIEALGLSAEEVESLVTVPLEQVLSGVPGLGSDQNLLRTRDGPAAGATTREIARCPGDADIAKLGVSSGYVAALVGDQPDDEDRDFVQDPVCDRFVDDHLLDYSTAVVTRSRGGQCSHLGHTLRVCNMSLKIPDGLYIQKEVFSETQNSHCCITANNNDGHDASANKELFPGGSHLLVGPRYGNSNIDVRYIYSQR
jgi:hypothetical protein